MNTRFLAGRSFGVVLGLSVIGSAALADNVVLAPELAGQYAAGSGVTGSFLKVHDNWQQSSVLWDTVSQTFGAGAPVSSFAWGTGLWGIADWQTANHSPVEGMIESRWSGRVSSIAFGDASYNSLYAATWGNVPLAPLFAPGDSALSQDNWTSHFAGYIRISEAGTYNFSVLHDDGFFFRLGGDGSQSVGIENDYLNPRDSLGFSSNLQLDVGLYSFELGAYDRLEAGVVELSWARDGAAWTRVPSAHLVAPDDVSPVPEPGTWMLMLAGLLGTGVSLVRRRSSTP